jgi:hypothetical protein
MIDDGDCGAIGGIKIGGGNRSTRSKPAPASLCPPQIPHDQTQARTRAVAVGSQRLTVLRAMVRSHMTAFSYCLFRSFLFGVLFNPVDEDDMFVRNVG